MTSEHADHDHGHGHDHDHEIMDQAWWDDRYQSAAALWSGHPNAQLVSEAAGLVAGEALDVGCGEGADAIWLAEHGWRVTAVDISTVALQRGAARALEVGDDVAGRITWLQADITDWVPAPSTYDLVSAQFMHLPGEQRDVLHRRLAESVAPGGILLVVGHDLSDRQTSVPRLGDPGRYFRGSDVVASLAAGEWVTLVDEERPRETLDPDGRPATIRDAVLKAQRTR